MGYQELLKANEYFYRLSDKELLALIVQVTGVEANNRAAQLTAAALKVLKQYANFEVFDPIASSDERQTNEVPGDRISRYRPRNISSPGELA